MFQGRAVKLWRLKSRLKVIFVHHLHRSYGFCPLAKVSGERVGQETAAIVSCLLAARRLCDRESCEFLAEGKTSGKNGSFSTPTDAFKRKQPVKAAEFGMIFFVCDKTREFFAKLPEKKGPL